jgi:hypothetical protein
MVEKYFYSCGSSTAVLLSTLCVYYRGGALERVIYSTRITLLL